MPIPMWFSDEPGVIDPRAFAAEIESELAILCFTRRIFSLLRDSLGLPQDRPAPRLPRAVEGTMDSRVVLYHSSFGSPAAGMLMQALIASGVRRFVMLGQAGSLSPRCRIGSVVLPSFGVREEGTSYHYLPPAIECRPSPVLFQRLKTALEPFAPFEGGVWSTDAPYRETRQKVELYARQGVLAVEMECTALMSVAMYRGVEFAGVLVITDELFGEKWEEGFQAENLRSAEERVSKALAESVDYLLMC